MTDRHPRTAGAALIDLDARAASLSDRAAVRAGVARLAAFAADAPVDRAGLLAPADLIRARLEFLAWKFMTHQPESSGSCTSD